MGETRLIGMGWGVREESGEMATGDKLNNSACSAGHDMI